MKVNGEALKAIRLRTGETLVLLAAKTGIDRTVLGRLETGERKGTPMQIRLIAEALQVPQTAITTPEVGDLTEATV